ncbi:7,8-dihydroneopterin aldolase [Halobacillus andaensis]|uniref:7,8-dihydroneopterin aldolase n=1 Tax=Halobacillus andaensis TaxID=1176239 RepID=A0A917BB63_HALAA|nr:dihydroneopterin aldolase [Halobacillus andaensis]MBP2006651.1 dihydroneopterin aldolase [Halobacillus andaensis]GGF35537.1 7,8-dihydroneopterin aldolase [Halobacillus andaensis]
MDQIQLNGMEFWGYHGLFPEENKLGQRFYVDLELEMDLQPAGHSDDMTQSIDYGEVYQITKRVVEGETRNLVEAVAEHLADELLQYFSQLEACRVKVTKPDPPIPGHYQSVAIDIYRSKHDE